MLAIPARLHEKPIVIAIGAMAGAVANAVLAAFLMPAGGEVGAAQAAGVGMFFGGGLVMLIYLLVSKTRLSDSTYFVLATPVLLLLPTWVIGPLWALILPVCVFSPWVFDARQKKVLSNKVQKALEVVNRYKPWKASR